jgi:hypothetical protein
VVLFAHQRRTPPVKPACVIAPQRLPDDQTISQKGQGMPGRATQVAITRSSANQRLYLPIRPALSFLTNRWLICLPKDEQADRSHVPGAAD